MKVPVASSSLLQIPLVQRLLPAGKRVGVLSVHGDRITPDIGKQLARRSTRRSWEPRADASSRACFSSDEMEMDYEKAEQDILEAGEKLLKKHPEVGAFVVETHNMGPYSRALNDLLRIPIYDVCTFVRWFQSGLEPRDYGHPGSSTLPVWRESVTAEAP